MKKYLFTILVLWLMLVILVETAAAAPTASGVVTLVGVEHGYKGPIFTFSTSGKFSKAELKGSVHVQGGVDYGLYCTQVDETIVKCTTSKEVSGVNVSLSWGGSTFWTFVPNAPPQFCYDMIDWTPAMDDWQLYGQNCQRTPANYGDSFVWDNPYWVHLHIYSYRRAQYAPSIILEMHITIPAVRILINENR